MLSLFLSCYEPSPLYGTWSDNDGNKISFISGGSFIAKIKSDSDGTTITYEGDFTVIDNVISFSYTNSSGKSVVMDSEWDIRGAMLYLYYTMDGTTKLLTLYQVSK